MFRSDATFELFVADEGNPGARDAAGAFARSEVDGPHSTLHLLGGSGTGKTHLLHAIGNQIRADRPAETVGLTSGREVAAALVSAISGRPQPDPPLSAIIEVDVLLVDHAEHFVRRPRTWSVVREVLDQRDEPGRRTVLAWYETSQVMRFLDEEKDSLSQALNVVKIRSLARA